MKKSTQTKRQKREKVPAIPEHFSLLSFLDELDPAFGSSTLGELIPRLLSIYLGFGIVLLYLQRQDKLHLVSSSETDSPEWISSLLRVAKINPLSLQGDEPEVEVFQSGRPQQALLAGPDELPYYIVPLISRKQILGVVVAGKGNAQENPSVQLTHLARFAHMAALTLEHAQYFQSHEKRIRELSIINQVGTALSSTLELRSMLTILAEQAARVIGANIVQVILSPTEVAALDSSYTAARSMTGFTSDSAVPAVMPQTVANELPDTIPGELLSPRDKQDFLIAVHGEAENLILPTTTSAMLLQRKEPLIIDDVVAAGLEAEVDNDQIKSLYAYPLLVQNRQVGVLILAFTTPTLLTPENRTLIQFLAHQANITLNNAVLFSETLATRNQTRFLLEQAEEALSFQETILQNMASGLITVNMAGYITSFNRAATDLLGWEAMEAFGLPIEDVLLIEADTPNPLRQTLLTRVPLRRSELEVMTRDGELIYLGLSTSPLLNAQNEMIGALAAFNDLSAIHALEEEKRRLDRLAMIGQMAAGIAHEIRNPLAAIKTGIQVLAWQIANDPASLESVQIIKEEIDRLDGTIKELLLFARPHQMQLADVDLIDIIEHVLQVLHPQLVEAHVEVDRCYSAALRLKADKDQIKQVLINLLLNAIQAMPTGGQLFIQGTVSASQRIALEIRDTGSGITPDDIDKIFVPFFTTKAHGIGLGLAISRRVIEEHSGTINVHSQPGEGTTFTIVLPAIDSGGTTPPKSRKKRGKEL